MRKIYLLFLILIVGSFIFGFSLSYLIFNKPIKPLSSNKFELLNEVSDLIVKNYVDEKNEVELCKGLVSSLNDPYSNFFTPEEYSKFREDISGEYVGIGVLIGVRDNKIKILQVFKNSPAYEVGLPVGSFIIEVDGVTTEGLSLDEVANMVRGKEGTYVNVKVEKDSETFSFRIQRRKIIAETVSYKILDNIIGYLKILTFTDSTPKEVLDALSEFKKIKIKGLILDIRDNPGGLLSSLQKVSDYLLPEGTLFYTEKKGERVEFKTYGTGLDMPMVVLVNENSASASEILAGAIKDRKLGTLIGTKTYGKGLIQTIYNIKGGYGLELTTERYLTPSLYSLNGKGIEPDIIVEYKENKEDPFMDSQMVKAIEYLKSLIK
ncbi:MAG: S41 family peptidase [Caldisericia bacterium]|nr:S41 family peptidase [Caldisericia bacterium]